MTDRPAPLRIVAARLTAAGLAARYHRVRDGGYVVVHRSHTRRDAEMIIDTDGHTALHYWTNLAADPVRVAETVIRALDAVNRPESRPSHQRAAPVARYDGSATECVGDPVMPGSQDQVAEPDEPENEPDRPDKRPPRETDTPREGSKSGDTLVERMEQLPPNHPSSPFNEDGSRKPLPPSLKDLDRPALNKADTDSPPPHTTSELAHSPNTDNPASPDHDPGDSSSPTANKSPRSRTDHPTPGVDSPDDPTVGPDGSWDWKDLRLTSDQSRTGDSAAERCRSAEGRDMDGNYGEHGLTPAMRRIEAQLEHGRLVDKTEEFALKSVDRFKEKLAREIIRQPDKAADEIASQIHDGIRYTFVFEPKDYHDGVREAHDKLESAGYRLDVRRNSWSSAEYKGINSRWHDPSSGLPFEIQFHTHDSWKVKQATHDAYERIANPRTPPDEVKRLKAYQAEMSSSLEVPLGANEIADYQREGR